MPNWTSNKTEITITNEDDMEKAIATLKIDKNDEFDFKNIIPNKSKVYSRDWMLENVGSKWFPSEIDVDISDQSIVIGYESAWSPVNEAILSVSKLLIEAGVENSIVETYEEPGMAFFGEVSYVDGERINDFYGEWDYSFYDDGFESNIEEISEWADEEGVVISEKRMKELLKEIENTGGLHIVDLRTKQGLEVTTNLCLDSFYTREELHNS